MILVKFEHWDFRSALTLQVDFDVVDNTGVVRWMCDDHVTLWSQKIVAFTSLFPLFYFRGQEFTFTSLHALTKIALFS